MSEIDVRAALADLSEEDLEEGLLAAAVRENARRLDEAEADLLMDDVRREQTRRKAPPRHPAQVTVDRLNDHLEQFADQLTPRELSAFGRVVLALEAIAGGER